MPWLIGPRVLLLGLASDVDAAMNYPRMPHNAATGEPRPDACWAMWHALVEPHPKRAGMGAYWVDALSQPYVDDLATRRPALRALRTEQELPADWR